jgi:SAM-dependent methyltransferase
MDQPGRGYQEGFYDLNAKIRDQKNQQEKAQKIFFILQNFSDLPLDKMSCLDIGCSKGYIVQELPQLFRLVLGLDYDIKALQSISVETRQAILFIHGDAMRLPFPDQSFEAIICSQVYEHVPSDLMLFAEIERILKPGGVVFFSGPNKLFPVEPHYYLPFLHWLPEKWADGYLRLLRKGTHFYERSRTPWNLRKVFARYRIKDVSIPVMRLYESKTKSKFTRLVYRLILKMPIFWKSLLVFLPNFNWLLYKPASPAEPTGYEIVS